MGDDNEADEDSLPPESTLEELAARHERELKGLEERSEAHIATVKSESKGKKAKAALSEAERQVEQWRYDLEQRQAEEHEAREKHLSGDMGINKAEDGGIVAEADAKVEATKKAEAEANARAAEEARALQKKEKGLKKRQGRAAKEAERQATIDSERAEAGPSARAVELAQLQQQLAKLAPRLKVSEVAADGNCLYRAVGDQLRRVRPDLHSWTRPPEFAHQEVRQLCAAALRRGEDGYSPFAELAEGEDFAGYCGRVENSADWGGELELRALADALQTRILVHRAGEPEPLALGPKGLSGMPLQVTYHRHYYTLGEHYNSTVPLEAQ